MENCWQIVMPRLREKEVRFSITFYQIPPLTPFIVFHHVFFAIIHAFWLAPIFKLQAYIFACFFTQQGTSHLFDFGYYFRNHIQNNNSSFQDLLRCKSSCSIVKILMSSNCVSPGVLQRAEVSFVICLWI